MSETLLERITRHAQGEDVVMQAYAGDLLEEIREAELRGAIAGAQAMQEKCIDDCNDLVPSWGDGQAKLRKNSLADFGTHDGMRYADHIRTLDPAAVARQALESK